MVKKNTAKKIIFLSIEVIIFLALVTGFILIAEDVMYAQVLRIDMDFHDDAMAIRSPWLIVVFKIITNLANPIVLGFIGIVLLLTLKNNRHYCFSLFLNMGIIALLNLLLKSFFVRDRPDATLSLITEEGFSFPSGHAMISIAFYGFIIYIINRSSIKAWGKIVSTTLLVSLILLICYSRIFLGVHYASDVIGAILVSIAYMMVFLTIDSRISLPQKLEKGNFKKHSVIKGFAYALKGILTAVKEESNLLIQFAVSMLVVVFGVFLRITMTEWAICLSLCFLVIFAEMINTAIENICDRITLEKDEKIRKIKDISAGAVLIMSIGSIIIGAIIFMPKVGILFI